MVRVGNLNIGGDSPISVQSMTTTDTRDAKATISQIHRLEEVGCDLVRVAVVDMDAAKNIANIKKEINIPIVADIHFDHRLALEAVKSQVDGIRINPGNIGSLAKTKEVVSACKDNNIPIRIGVNGGSLEKDLLNQYGGPVAEAMVESAMRHVRMSRLLSISLATGISSVGSPVWEILIVSPIPMAKEKLRSLDILNDKIKIVSCPTCGRCNKNLIDLASEVEEKISSIDKDITVAIMGCAVNGPGEAREADIGIAGGDKVGLLFKKGEIIRKIPQETIVDTLLEEINNL